MVTINYYSLLDLIFLINKYIIIYGVHPVNVISDHYLSYCFNGQKIQPEHCNKNTFREFKNLNITVLKNNFNTVTWKIISIFFYT